MSFLITAHARAYLAQSDLAQAVAQRTGQALRRANPLASLALLACWDVLAQEQSIEPEAVQLQQLATGPTALIWHSQQGPQPETEALLAAQQTGDGLLLPFDFLASQPGLLCVQLKPWLPDLAQTLFLPGTAHPHEQAWMQMLPLAHFWLVQKCFGRVICATFERDDGICRYAALCLAQDSLTDVSEAERAESAHGGMTGTTNRRADRSMNRTLLRGHWLPTQAAQAVAEREATDSRVPAHQADAALWRWLESGSAIVGAEQTMVLPAQGACLHLQRLHH